jgi:hypothetical protein
MQGDLNRGEILAQLDKLGSFDDAEALGAARELNRQVKAAGMTWDALLLPERPVRDGDDDDTTGSLLDHHGGDDVLVAPNADHGSLNEAEKDEARALIDAIGKMQVSDTTRDELAEYASDLLESRMEQMDLRYLRALKKRLDG